MSEAPHTKPNSKPTTPTDCPQCGKRDGVPLLRGFPTEEHFELASRGEIVLGGCVVDGTGHDRECRNCGHRWRASRKNAEKSQARTGGRPARKGSKKRRRARSAHALDPVAGTSPSGVPSGARSDYEVRAGNKVSLWPTLAAFVAAWLICSMLAGAAICNDGWHSGAGGRSGACSHHGGVSRLSGFLAFVVSAVVAVAVHSVRERRAQRNE